MNEFILRVAISEAFLARTENKALTDAALDRLVSVVLAEFEAIPLSDDLSLFEGRPQETRKVSPHDLKHALAVLPVNR